MATALSHSQPERTESPVNSAAAETEADAGSGGEAAQMVTKRSRASSLPPLMQAVGSSPTRTSDLDCVVMTSTPSQSSSGAEAPVLAPLRSVSSPSAEQSWSRVRAIFTRLLFDQSTSFAIASYLARPGMASAVSSADDAELPRAIVTVMAEDGVLLPFVQNLVALDVAACSKPVQIFRSASALSSILGVFMKPLGGGYLDYVLRRPLAGIISGRTSFELDPHVIASQLPPSSTESASGHSKGGDRIDKGQVPLPPDGVSGLQGNLKALFACVRTILDQITVCLDNMPSILLEIFATAEREARARFTASSASGRARALANLFFLRFLCPAIVIPQDSVNFNHFDPSPLVNGQLPANVRAELLLVSKIIQACASGSNQEFDLSAGAEWAVEPVRRFIAEQQAAIGFFAEQLCSRGRDVRQVSIVSRTTNVLEHELIVTKQSRDLRSMMREVLDALDSAQPTPHNWFVTYELALDSILLAASQHREGLEHFLVATESTSTLWVQLRDVLDSLRGRRHSSVGSVDSIQGPDGIVSAGNIASTAPGATRPHGRRKSLFSRSRPRQGSVDEPQTKDNEELRFARMALESEREERFIQQQLARYYSACLVPDLFQARDRAAQAELELANEIRRRRELEAQISTLRTVALPTMQKQIGQLAAAVALEATAKRAEKVDRSAFDQLQCEFADAQAVAASNERKLTKRIAHLESRLRKRSESFPSRKPEERSEGQSSVVTSPRRKVRPSAVKGNSVSVSSLIMSDSP